MEEMKYNSGSNIKGSRQDISGIVCTCTYQSPCGTLLLGSLDDKLCLCDWADAPHRLSVDRRLAQALRTVYRPLPSAVTDEAIRQLDEYFGGKRHQFTVPLRFIGTTFQQSVWNRLLEIPYGMTVSYGELAELVGKPHSVRAVAKACAANAISIFAPCHRVIGADGVATGYAGGSSAKKFLLDLEQKMVRNL